MEFVEASGPEATPSTEGYMEFERNYRRLSHELGIRVAATQNTSPYINDDSWLGAQGYIRGSADMSTQGYRLHGTDDEGVYTSRHAYYHPLTQMHNNIISHY